MSAHSTDFCFQVRAHQAGVRLDSVVAGEIDACSRSYAAELIRQGQIRVDGAARKPGYVLKAGEAVSGHIPPLEAPAYLPEKIPLQILYEDAHLLVVNKAPGMVVHPAPGHSGGTLVNALLHHCPDLGGIAGSLRPGIVHRLDKDTSGALVVAKNGRAMAHLADQFKSRRVHKLYLALAYGNPDAVSGTIDLPIGRHPEARKTMSVHTRTPRTALTLWRVVESFAGASLLELDIRTGRTHQIRVHCQALGHPVIGDPVYNRRGAPRQLALRSADMARAAASAQRQMLHARELQIHHPETEALIRIVAPLPPDMDSLLHRFREISGTGAA